MLGVVGPKLPILRKAITESPRLPSARGAVPRRALWAAVISILPYAVIVTHRAPQFLSDEKAIEAGSGKCVAWTA